ncbi:MAG TPA: response regulator, partial [Candidatus Binataceae bacterium]|nr:response regulator [Candidatus Binataceae bacterium]
LMDGHVWAESTVGKGSTFFFTAHFGIDSAHADVQASTPKLGGMKILVTDDNQTSRTILAEMLTQYGAYVAQSASAADSVSLIRNAAEAGSGFNLMFIDQRMPEIDGVEMVQTLRRLMRKPAPVVLMVTSTAFSADRVRMQELGLRDYLFKPVRRHDLQNILTEALAKREARTPAEREARILAKNAAALPANHHASGELRPLRILLADDSPDNRLIVKAFLQKTPFSIDEAENGERAVAKVTSNDYDLVLMDIQMPVLDGFAATRTIREWEKACGRRPVPIVALTASALDEDVQRARDAGCNLHVSKPIKKKTLMRAIANLTDEGESAGTFATMIAL